MAQFLDAPSLKPNGDGINWTLVGELRYVRSNGDKVTVPSGFVTDLASVPRLFWSIFPPFGVYDYAAIVHDWMYRHHWNDPKWTRNYCDSVLIEAMAELGTSLWARWTIWVNVRTFGWAAWPSTPKTQ